MELKIVRPHASALSDFFGVSDQRYKEIQNDVAERVSDQTVRPITKDIIELADICQSDEELTLAMFFYGASMAEYNRL